MRAVTIVLTGLTLLAGCAHGPEATRTDEAWGQAQQSSWARLIAFPEGKQPEAVPEGLMGAAVEQTMGVYIKTFAEKPTKTDVFQLGVVKSQ